MSRLQRIAIIGLVSIMILPGLLEAQQIKAEWVTQESCQQERTAALRIAKHGKSKTSKIPKSTGSRLNVSDHNADKAVIEGLKGPIVRRRNIEAAEKAYQSCLLRVPQRLLKDGTCGDTMIPQWFRPNPRPGQPPDYCAHPPEPKYQVITPPKLFNVPPDGNIKVAFNGGSTTMRYAIMSIAMRWAWHTKDPVSGEETVKFDFGNVSPFAMQFREWSANDLNYAADIRISFEPNDGYWSLIGNDSLNQQIVYPGEPSMNLAGMDGYSELPKDWRRIVYHEFGHALGLEHEHQHPNSVCGSALRLEDEASYQLTLDASARAVPDSSGRKPGVLTSLEHAPNYWSREMAYFNLAQLQNDDSRLTTAYDPNSIMKYEFPEAWYKDDAPIECRPSGTIPGFPSRKDYEIVRDTYIQAREKAEALGTFP